MDPRNFANKRLPPDSDVRRLIDDAISANPKRYGAIVAIDGGKVSTSTGVEITLDWPTLSLTQSGRDTRLLDRLYKIHYLQWLGRPFPDALLGVLGIVLLLSLTGLGLAVLVSSRRK